MYTKFINANIFQNTGFITGSFYIKDGRFLCVGTDENDDRLKDEPFETVDLQNRRVLPGLIDIHIHGAVNADFSDAIPEELCKMSDHLVKCGITHFLPTAMTLPIQKLDKIFSSTDINALSTGARIEGFRMEGPYLSKEKCGAQNPEYLKLPDTDEYMKLQEAAGGNIKIVDIAPELPFASDFIRQVSKTCRISLAHTACDYETAIKAYQSGATGLTHLFNAMPQIHHRDTGVIGAASEDPAVIAELICDGLHVAPSAIRMAFRLFPDRICLISDALRCLGMPDGSYELGGQDVILNNKEARLKNGALAGSVTNLYEGMVNAIRFGIPEPDAINAASITPARCLGIEKKAGSIEAGKIADFLICDDNYNLLSVYMGGKLYHSHSNPF